MNIDSKLSFLRRIFGVYRYHPNTKEAEFFSPFCHHHKPKLSINLETDRWRDWITGKNGKKLFYPIKEAGGTKEQIREYIQTYKAEGVVVTNFREVGKVEIKNPKGSSAIVSCKKSLMGRRAWDYLMSRGVEEQDVLRYKVGVMPEPDAIVFPSFDKKGNLNFFTTRCYTGRYNNPDVPRTYKNSIIPNELNIDWKKPVVLTEGFMDMLKSIRNTVPLLGSSLHEETALFEKLVEEGSEVVLALDADAWKKTEYIAKKLARYDLSVYTVSLGGYSDLGEMPKEAFAEIYEARKEWSPEESFREKLRTLC